MRIICKDHGTNKDKDKSRQGKLMARIAGINIPSNQHLEIGLTSILELADLGRERYVRL